MNKRLWSLALSAALVAGVLSAFPAIAQEAPAPRVIPAEPNIVDAQGDANIISTEGGPAGGPTFTRADIWAAWFTADAEFVYAHIQTELGGRGQAPYFYRVRTDPGGGAACLWFTGYSPSSADPGAPGGQLRDTCDGKDDRIPAEMLLESGPEETGVYTIKVPRSAHPALVDGATLAGPWAEVTQWIGGNNTSVATAPPIDDTAVGTDYTIGGGGSVVTPEPDPTVDPGSDPKPKPKPKKCKKKANGRKVCPKKKPKPKPPVVPPGPPAGSCPTYVPGEEGAEAETTIVNDAATAEKPVVVELTAGAGLGNDLGIPGIAGGPSVYDETSSIFQNIQVDSSNPDAGLYATLNFPAFHDYDLYLNRPDGSTAANSGDFNIAPGEGLGGGGPDGAWEAGNDFESVLGIRTPDCGGYTARMVSFLTNGGAVTLSLWLGEIKADPVPPEEPAAFGLFYSLMGLS
jgi:hypothetical protein